MFKTTIKNQRIKAGKISAISLIVLMLISVFSSSVLASSDIGHNNFKEKKYYIKISEPTENYQKNADLHVRNQNTGLRSTSYYPTIHHKRGDWDIKYFCIEPFSAIRDQAESYQAIDIGKRLEKSYGWPEHESNTMAATLAQITYFGHGCLPKGLDKQLREDYMIATQYLLWETLGFNMHLENFYNYDELASDIRTRMDNWTKDSSLHNASYELDPGQSLNITDENGILVSFLKNAGFNLDSPVSLGEGITASWQYPNTLIVKAPSDFKGELEVNLTSQGDTTVYAFERTGDQSIISTMAAMPPRTIKFTLISSANEIPNPESEPEPEPEKVLTGGLKILKTGPQIISWEVSEKILVKGKTESVYHPVIEDRPLAGIQFKLVSLEDLIYKDREYKSGELKFELCTDETGLAVLEEAPIGKYQLIELPTREDFIPIEPIELEIEADAEPLVDQEPYQIRNENRKLYFNFTKQLEEGKNLSYQEVKKCLSEIYFVLRTKEALSGLEFTLPEGSIVGLATLDLFTGIDQVISILGDDSEEINQEDLDLYAKVNFTIPMEAEYSLEEVNDTEIYQGIDAIDLNFSQASIDSIDELGNYHYRLAVPVYNKLLRGSVKEPDTPDEDKPNSSEVVENLPTSPSNLPVETSVLIPNLQVDSLPVLSPPQANDYQEEFQAKVMRLPSTGEIGVNYIHLLSLIGLASFIILLKKKIF